MDLYNFTCIPNEGSYSLGTIYRAENNWKLYIEDGPRENFLLLNGERLIIDISYGRNGLPFVRYYRERSRNEP